MAVVLANLWHIHLRSDLCSRQAHKWQGRSYCTFLYLKSRNTETWRWHEMLTTVKYHAKICLWKTARHEITIASRVQQKQILRFWTSEKTSPTSPRVKSIIGSIWKLVFIFYGAILYIRSRRNPEKYSKKVKSENQNVEKWKLKIVVMSEEKMVQRTLWELLRH